jgi:nicotinamidase-related amidase
MKSLIVIEMQNRIDAGSECVNPEAPKRIAECLAVFRNNGWPVIHIRHDADAEDSPFHPAAPSHQGLPICDARGDEQVMHKRTSSAFASTSSEAHLRRAGINELMVIGAVAGFCVASTVRAGADLGFTMAVVRDAILGFDLPASDERRPSLRAQTVFDVTMALLGADYARVIDARVIDTRELLDLTTSAYHIKRGAIAPLFHQDKINQMAEYMPS